MTQQDPAAASILRSAFERPALAGVDPDSGEHPIAAAAAAALAADNRLYLIFAGEPTGDRLYQVLLWAT